ncbi:homeobox protein MOX-2 [Platysternon megacephalum]|uniref:Homeobox protein MOX-2 n=1 Tax=Platysternon megacephalum TaxID=55544 RepID=A0A4D9EI47_9SAUR|nr:homeobox protein MOX-2 [Platysternon megacephalum]
MGCSDGSSRSGKPGLWLFLRTFLKATEEHTVLQHYNHRDLFTSTETELLCIKLQFYQLKKKTEGKTKTVQRISNKVVCLLRHLLLLSIITFSRDKFGMD